VITLLRCEPHRTYVDATVGGGGHTLAILNRTAPDGRVIGVEWDEEALSEARRVLEPFGERVTLVRQSFTHLPEILTSLGIEGVDGILLDLGLSSLQLKRGERGFSLKGEGPLDMRMDQRTEITAADLVNQLSKQELEKIFREYGEERWAKRIAGAIVGKREQGPIRTTQALRRIVHQAIPRRYHSRRIDPATKTFQALRIQVNDELGNLKEILEHGWTCLKQGGRLCIMSFHSLEDRMVKNTFRRMGKRGKGEGQDGVLHLITKKPITPSEEERRRNPRSRSAKLRCAERV